MKLKEWEKFFKPMPNPNNRKINYLTVESDPELLAILPKNMPNHTWTLTGDKQHHIYPGFRENGIRYYITEIPFDPQNCNFKIRKSL